MSLDVYLTLEGVQNLTPYDAIFVREDGRLKELTRTEWDTRYPDREPIYTHISEDRVEVFSRNITHNLNDMADAAGLYRYLWRPDEINISIAADLIAPLTHGLERLRANPDKYRSFNPSNGWGKYEGLVDFVESYLRACIAYPEAKVSVSR